MKLLTESRTMVCPKLKKGSCKITKEKCKEKYEVKMQKYKSCQFFKKGKSEKKKESKKASKKGKRKLNRQKKQAAKKRANKKMRRRK